MFNFNNEEKLYKSLAEEAQLQQEDINKDAKRTQMRLSYFSEYKQVNKINSLYNEIIKEKQIFSPKNGHHINNSHIKQWLDEIKKLSEIEEDKEISNYLNDFERNIRNTLIDNSISSGSFEEMNRDFLDLLNQIGREFF